MRTSRYAAEFAYAAGITGVAANALLLGFYALQLGRPEAGTWLGTANDLVGSVTTALMLPVALALTGHLPRGRAARAIQAVGVSALAVLTVAGPLLVFGVLPFEVQMPIASAAAILLAAWVFLVSRALRPTGALPARVTRLGTRLGGGLLVACLIIGLGLLFPWMSWPQLALFGVGIAIAILGWLAIPVWFLMLGRHLPGRTVVLENSVELRRSPEDVFDYCSDLRNELAWNPTMVSVEMLTAGSTGLGTRYHARWKGSGINTLDVVAYRRPVAWAIDGTSARLDTRFSARVEPVERGARLTVRMELIPVGATRLLLPVLRRLMQREEARNMHRIKQALETPEPASLGGSDGHRR
jgi:hypothetical protein